MAAFHETRMGQEFFTKQLPELIRAISSLGDAIRGCHSLAGPPQKEEKALSIELAGMVTVLMGRLTEEQKGMLSAYLEKNAEREAMAVDRAFSQGVRMGRQAHLMEGEGLI